MTILRIARYRIRPEALEGCRTALHEIVEHVRANEPGTLFYTVGQAEGDPLSFVHCSAYVDGAALERHLGNTHMLERIRGVLEPAMTAPPSFEQFTALVGASAVATTSPAPAP